MTIARALILSPLVLLGLAVACASPSPHETVQTRVAAEVDFAMGSEERGRVEHAQSLMTSGRASEAWDEIDAVVRDFEARMQDPNAVYVSVADAAELARFRAEHPGARVVWIDWSYREALHMQAFLLANQEQYTQALSVLERESGIAPFAATAHAERGYVLNGLGRPREALAAYEEAIRLSDEFPSQAPWKAASLRGAGFSLIELGDLDRAEQRFLQSLELEPENALAQSELLFIKNVRAGGH